MNPSQATVIASVVLLGFACWVLVSVDHSVPVPQVPSVDRDEAVREVHVSLEPIAGFLHYYGDEGDVWRDDNPFIPYNLRVKEREKNQNGRKKRPKPPDDAEVLPPPPPRPQQNDSPIVVERPKPPPLNPDQLVTPEVIAMIGGANAPLLRVRFGDKSHSMRVGDEQHGWRLMAVTGTIVTFADADGLQQDFIIGGGPLAQVLGTPGGDGSGSGPGGPMIDPAMPGDGPGGPGGGDGGALLEEFMNHPDGRGLIERNPALRELILNNPDRARQLLKRLGGGAR